MSEPTPPPVAPEHDHTVIIEEEVDGRFIHRSAE